MKNITKKFLLSVILTTVISFAVKGLTNVSGGIYSNTTWTKANSPYIVTDTIVVFPGVTLTIQPGVIVKFADNKRIEFRQAKLAANAAISDSITFTSNSSSPTPGIYAGIYFNGGNLNSTFNYCNFKYAATGINANISGPLTINNSNFNQNVTGANYIGSTSSASALIDTTVFNANTNGLILKGLNSSEVNYCKFSYNSANALIIDDGGYNMTINYCNFLNNDTGILWNMHSSTINHCHFSNNVTGLQESGYMSMHDTYSNTTKNCVFNFNQSGIAGIGYMLVDSCTINHNQTGINGAGYSPIKNSTIDSNTVLGIATANNQVTNCNIKYNGAGIQGGSNLTISGNDIEYNTGDNINIAGSSSFGTVTITGNTINYGNMGIDNTAPETLIVTKNTIDYNNVGINLTSSSSTISYNKICNNTTYDLKYGASSNLNASHNCWCTSDSSSTEALIYDGYDNINYGLVIFMPIDTGCFFTVTGIHEVQTSFSFSIFPNPVTDNLTVEFPANISKTEIQIFNVLGELEYSATITRQKTEIDVSSFSSGIYFIQIATANNGSSRQKFIRQ